MKRVSLISVSFILIAIEAGGILMPLYGQKGNPPSIYTDKVTNIKGGTAHCGGIFGKLIEKPTAYGVCWSTSPNPTINNQRTIETKPYNSFGEFGSYVTGLNPNTFYYIRAYGTNSYGTGYGVVKKIKTLCVSDIANAGSDIFPACNSSMTTLAGNTPTAGMGKWTVVSGTATIISQNSPQSVVKQLAVPGKATLRWTLWPCLESYDDVVITTTTCHCALLSTFPDIDGNVYHTISIGTQCWMKENLKVTHYRNGDPIPNVTDANAWYPLISGACCDYDNTPGNSTIYGKLYNWYAIDDPRKICPIGWHVPTHDEWTTLARSVCTSNTCITDFPYNLTTTGWNGMDEGAKLKETGTAHWISPNAAATNCCGFSGLPAGSRIIYESNGGFSGSNFAYINKSGYWWSATNYNQFYAWFNSLNYQTSAIGSDYSFNGICKHAGLSVRCVKD
ncbi:MAG: fibrobacter succinogenes major paralogous domain-containing protein [Bacteroidetes bacterium]|nr:fibrobacter succinogenes major paralogous domain-containing protein [Bacteroidota bacterium]